MRIAFISSEFPPDNAPGGIATYVDQAVRAMASRGHEVEVFAQSPIGARTEGRSGVTIHWNAESAAQPFRESILPVFTERHTERPFDVVEAPEYNAEAAVIKQRFPLLPLVVKTHTPTLMIARLNGTYPPPVGAYLRQVALQFRVLAGSLRRRQRVGLVNPFISWWRRMDYIEAACARKAELVVCPCRDLMRYVVQRWGITPSKVRHLPNIYTPSADYLSIPIRSAGSRVLFLGRLEARKGIVDLAQAIPLVTSRVPNASFNFVGRPCWIPRAGMMADDLVRKIAGESAAAISFRGAVSLSSIPGELAQADVCAFPSVWENFPNVCLEAMAAGRAVVGSSSGGMAEMLAAESGILVEPGQPVCLAEAIASLLLDPTHRHAMGRRARQRVLNEYNAQLIGDLMESAYRDAIASTTPTR